MTTPEERERLVADLEWAQENLTGFDPLDIEEVAASISNAVSAIQSDGERLDALTKALRPFSEMAGELFARNRHRGEVLIALDNPGDLHRITVGDFFDARRYASQSPAPSSDPVLTERERALAFVQQAIGHAKKGYPAAVGLLQSVADAIRSRTKEAQG